LAEAASVEDFAFDRIYSHFFDRVIKTGAKEVFAKSVARYLRAIGGAGELKGPSPKGAR
jgi:hypothetical protein